MFKGYNGKVLFVDLSSGSIEEESLPEQVYRDFIGGQGLGARILYERMKPKVDPLGPDNMLGFLVGPLTGTGIHGARFQVVGKSPLTGGWGDANSGGSFAVELKAAGYDGVFFSGISLKPVYLFINKGKAQLRDASNLWGKDTVETEESIRGELGDEKVKVACVGPAGEAKSLLACIRHEGSAVGRSGLAAVMGAKRLKAFVVRGTQKASIADPERFAAIRKDYLKTVRETEHPFAVLFKTWGTCGVLSPSVVSADSPVKNWALYGEEEFPNHSKLSDDGIIKYQYKKHACTGCPLGCKGWYRIETKRYGVVESSKPEYETLSMMGPNCLVDDLEAISKANDVANRLGLDTIGTGSVIGFAMECYERGVITKENTDGIELTWGNGDALVAITEKIGKRDGFGAVLADGAKLAAERIGKGSEKWAIHVGGQDMPAHDPRVSIGFAWGYTVDATPARHTATMFKNVHDSKARFVADAELNISELDSLDMAVNAPIYAICSDLDRLWTSAGLCIFGAVPETMPIAEVISAITGWDFTLEEGLKAGRRIQTLRQVFNIREGVKTSEWRFPERLTVAQDAGPNEGTEVDFKAMKEKGYAALGWDPKTGKPLESTLHELGLKELVGKLS